ncbi:Hypothetical Protein PD5205_00736 [Xanthomonas fragariae]|uniref:TIGR02449 family protein n=2 Tax=Xanthomonas fragariae TaxID=48664 RepID=A0A1Y6HAF5_9XANT|nr:Hypothetical Protein NBC2815_03269 [Xanthomonas fragariae]SMR00495.1 hypothetical protein PD885_03274 [Xanthomonas fragariae]SMR02056.1 Hypothetical Protein PD5205_00736 [Xanthomonas fragariae]
MITKGAADQIGDQTSKYIKAPRVGRYSDIPCSVRAHDAGLSRSCAKPCGGWPEAVRSGYERRLTAARTHPYRERMDNASALAQIRALAARVEALVERTQRLTDENRSLRHQQEQLIGERSQLLTKNEQARSRVEAMIVRLKSLEQHT